MHTLLIPLAAFLAVVFAMSAVGKLRTSDRGRSAFQALRIETSRPDAAAVAIIAVEFAVSAALLVTTGCLFVAACLAAAALCVALLLAALHAQNLGATEDCGCFGEWMPAAIGPRLTQRNGILSLIAGILFIVALSLQLVGISTGLPLIITAPADITAELMGALVASVLVGAGVWAIVRASSASSQASDGSQPAATASGAVLLPAESSIVDLLAPGARARLVLFVSSGCHACVTALASIDDARDALTPYVDVYAVQGASAGAIDLTAAPPVPEGVRFALDVSGSLAGALEVGIARPVAALIGTDGAQAGPLALGSVEVAELVASVASLADAESV